MSTLSVSSACRHLGKCRPPSNIKLLSTIGPGYRSLIWQYFMSDTKPSDDEQGKIQFIDVGVNLTDPMFQGSYHGRSKHTDDLDAVVGRARAAGVRSMIITGTSLKESRTALEMAKKHKLYATVGCHPTCSKEFEQYGGGPCAYLAALEALLKQNLEGNGRAVAVGECGLDYDRTQFATPEVQRRFFRMQLGLAKKYHLPLFLHSRAAHADLVQILREEGFGTDGGRDVGGKGGVVHSFTGTIEELTEYLDMGFHISINGCSLKTEANLHAVSAIRPDRLLLETDSPWCSITTTHASYSRLETMPPQLRELYNPPATRPEKFSYGKPVKGRNEPSTIGSVAWVAHRLYPELSFKELTRRAWNNTIELFDLQECN